MAKIGRNEKCPCRSGKKYKHCCARKPENVRRAMTAEEKLKVTLMGAVQKVEQAAIEKKESLIELGVFVLYSTGKGDAWLFELTDCDCVQLMKTGEKLNPPINENSETIEIDWTHRFAFKSKKLILTAYADRAEFELTDAPSKRINAARKRIIKKFTPEQLKQVHLSSEQVKSQKVES